MANPDYSWPPMEKRKVIGQRFKRLDGPAKSSGRAKYSSDTRMKDLLFGAYLTSPHAHARVRGIDTSEAEKVQGVAAVHVAAPAGTEIQYQGWEVAAVAASTEEIAREAARLIKVDYEVLPHFVEDHDLAKAGSRARQGGERVVGDLLEWDDLSAPVSAVGGDEQPRLLVVDAIAQRLRTEAAEDHAVNRADPRAGQHGNRQLGNQRKVQRDAITFFDPQRFEDIGKLRDLAVEVVIGQRAAVAGLAFPDDRGFVASRSGEVAVDAIDTGVDFSADEPLGVRRIPLEHTVPRLRPVELARESRPERLRIAFRFGIDAIV